MCYNNQIRKYNERYSTSFAVRRSIIRSEISSILFRPIFILPILYLIFIINPPSTALSVMAQTLTLTTDTSYYIDNIVSARGHFDLATGELISGHNRTDYDSWYYDGNNSRIQHEIICPNQGEIAIYIHGVWTDETSANEQFNRTAKSLATNNYSIPLIGFSWDSNTHLSKNGWEVVKNIAKDNGQKLAQFIFDFKNKCRDTDTRLIAHSSAYFRSLILCSRIPIVMFSLTGACADSLSLNSLLTTLESNCAA